MAKREILLTAYSPVSSNTFSERLHQIERSLDELIKSENSTNRKLEEFNKDVIDSEEIRKETGKLANIRDEIKRLEEIKRKIEQRNDEIIKHDSPKEWRVLFDTVNKVWNPKIENSEFEGLHLNHAYTTSESAFKELVIPYTKREGYDGKRIEKHEACKIEKIFAFTTEKVKKFNLKNTYYHNGDEIMSANHQNGGVGMINETFIEDRLQAIHKFADNGIEELKFEHLLVEENGVNPTASIHSVLKMVELVQSYIKEYEGDEFIIHADMSGGFRHIPLILMMVLNILQRSNHTIGEIMYTMLLPGEVKIERINDIFDMQRFTNGVHEFIEFGSGEELGEYYTLSKQKTNLESTSEDYDKKIDAFIKAVKQFSEAITLSDRNEFRHAVKSIESAWKALKQDLSDKKIQKQLEYTIEMERKRHTQAPTAIENNLGLLKTFLPRIETEYKQLWETDDDLDYILWCLDHNFIQQALTLYAEIFPEVVISGDRPIIQLESGFHKKLRKEFDSKVYTFPFWLLNHYSWAKTLNINEAKPDSSEENSNQDDAQNKEDDTTRMPWSRRRKEVDAEIEVIKKSIGYSIKEALSKLVSNGVVIKSLREAIADPTATKEEAIVGQFLGALGTLAEEIQFPTIDEVEIDVDEQQKYIVALATLFAYPFRLIESIESIVTDAEKERESSKVVGNIARKGELVEYVKKQYTGLPEYYERLVTAYIIDIHISAKRPLKMVLSAIKCCDKEFKIRKQYFLFAQMSAEAIQAVFIPHRYSPRVRMPYEISRMDDEIFVKKVYDYLIEKDIIVQTVNLEGICLEELQGQIKTYWPHMDVDEDWQRIAPASLGGRLPELDENGVSYADLLILRSLFVPYKLIKNIRNASVHARTDRDGLVTKDSLTTLLRNSVMWLQCLKSVFK